jgi:gamma-glutamylcyclotransferase (GGCT)/AIG2-like uncharacterized protein YtfP
MNPAPERLFVYGTLVDSTRRRRLLGRDVEAEPGRLDGYARGRGRYHFVVAKTGATVEGAILHGLSPRDFAVLDEYEDLRHLYTRERAVARDRDGRDVECWVYLPTGWERRGRK